MLAGKMCFSFLFKTCGACDHLITKEMRFGME